MHKEKRILVVDDDAAIRTLLFTILRRRGLVVDTARDGADALERLANCHYSVMLLDLMMPTMSGWEVLQQLERHPPPIMPIVIVLTAGNEPHNLNPSIIAASVRKPFDIEVLTETIMVSLAAIAEQEQREHCPPAQSVTPETTEKVN